MNNRKRLMIISILVIAMCFTIGCGSKESNKLNGESETYADDVYGKEAAIGAQEINEYRKYTVDVNETHEMDGYTYTLEKAMYDKNTCSGYLEMKITSEEHDVSKLLVCDNFGTNINDGVNDFSFIALVTKSNIYGKCENGAYHIYMAFVDEAKISNDKIEIDSLSTKNKIEFSLPDTKTADCFITSNGHKIYISPVTLYFGDGMLPIDSLIVHMKDGEEIIVVEDGNICGNVVYTRYEKDSFYYLNEFYEYKEIDYLERDNVKIMKK